MVGVVWNLYVLGSQWMPLWVPNFIGLSASSRSLTAPSQVRNPCCQRKLNTSLLLTKIPIPTQSDIHPYQPSIFTRWALGKRSKQQGPCR